MIALTNGRLYTIENGIIEQGTILLDGGKIAAVGAEVEISADTQVIDVQGRIVTPGFIDAHTHIGIDEDIHQPMSVVETCHRAVYRTGGNDLVHQSVDMADRRSQ